MSIICFIDDSPFEHNLVRNDIAPCTEEFEFVYAYTFDEAKTLLNSRTPSLFLLDLWGQDESITDPYITPRVELEKKIKNLPSLDYIYKDIAEFEGDSCNEYLRRFFSIVDGWRTMFEDVCARIGQNRKYGLSNLLQARIYYPDVPAVFYTRKSLINDAVAMFRAKSDGLFIKPTGSDDTETSLLTKKYAPQLISELKKFITT